MSDITLFDIETAPSLYAAYGAPYDAKVVWIERDPYMTCFAYKKVGEKGIMCKSLRDYPLYKTEPHNDRELARDLHKVMNEAKILCAYNGNSFDIKIANGIFAKHGFPAIREEITIDPYREGKKVFNFISHKLEYLAKMAGVKGKQEHGGVMQRVVQVGDKASWEKHEKYCMQDIRVLEGVYLWMRPWMKAHPNLNITAGTLTKCPRCLSNELIKDGFKYKVGGRYQKYICKGCGNICNASINLIEKPLVK
jgi:hypothetical protein